jgi:TolA-binding protein
VVPRVAVDFVDGDFVDVDIANAAPLMMDTRRPRAQMSGRALAEERRMRFRLTGSVLLAGCLLSSQLVMPPAAVAQMDSREGIALQNQILELRRDMQILQQQIAGGVQQPSYRPAYPPQSAPGAGDLTAQLLDRVDRLEEQVRSLRGRLDEIDNARQQQYNDLAKQIADLNFRLQNGGSTATPPAVAPPAPGPGGRPLANAPATPAVPGVPPSAPAARRLPELILQEGNAALARRDYAAAEAAARELLAGPRTPRSTDGQFLLAEALSGQRNYAQSAVAYDDAYKRSPSGVHAQDSMLGLAASLTALGAKREACEALDQMHGSFPNPRPDLRGQITETRARAGCR